MSGAAWHFAVLIPARNEEALLPRCLRSVQRARRALPADVTTDLIVVADSCTDRTGEIARELLGRSGSVVSIDAGRVGVARALAAKAALSRYAGGLERCWLANTDADCMVPEDWLLMQLAMAERGATAVAGIVDVDTFEEHQECVERLFRMSYVLYADGTHPHVHGANMGVRADAYLRAGGWGAQATAEDHDLWGRLRHVERSRISDAALKVTTSGRRVGKAPSGFAEALAAHNGLQG